MRIFIDADACPVKDEAIKVAVRHGLPIIFVSNSWMRLDDHPLIERIIVSEGPDEADNRIVELMAAGDIVVTSDIPLAGRALEKQGHVLGPTGKAFSDDNIGMALAMRELKQELRETGEIKGYNPGFTKADRSSFLQELENIIQLIKRGS
ncbi:MAG: UPF0178 protein [Rhodomicrobium sp.]|nr:MAG: UPF0178 protein [Rhodomicrobium sp.]